MAVTHRYQTRLSWSGSTGAGYRGYSRAHRVSTVAGDLEVSADRAFGGTAELLNPEQLLLAALSSCQLLSFLAEAARAGVDVLDYTDSAEAELPVTRGPMRITTVTLRPRIAVPAETDEATVRELVATAHRGCFIANTLSAEVRLEPVVVTG